MADYLRAADEIATTVVAANAPRVDKDGTFPADALDALRAAGLMGLVSAQDVGGMGEGTRAAVLVVERLARECGSTAMVMCMHYAGTAVLEKFGPRDIRGDIAAGNHLSTLAFSETGSRSHFWAPVSHARHGQDGIHLDATKSWVTSANHAAAYVWSSRPVAAEGPSTLWVVPRSTKGVHVSGGFDGLGLRGNDSTPVTAQDAVISRANMLGEDGRGLQLMLETVLPVFNALNAACSVGFMEGATAATCKHVTGTRYEHTDTTLADLPTIRAYVARMRVTTDQVRCLLMDTVDALEAGRADIMLRVLECKCAAGESATQVLDTAMRVCGGAAFRRDVGVERRFRDARAATIMAPTTDQLYDFIGNAVCGRPVF